MKDVLDQIIAHKKEELVRRKQLIGEGEMLQMAQQTARPTLSMRRALSQSASGIIAEHKRKSPSKGWIHPASDVAAVVSGYAQAGAAACSVLTDELFFGGSLADLVAARAAAPQLPLLRKEFIIDPYQLFEARSAGADAVLLIAACLGVAQCQELASVAHSLSLEVLLEIHTEAELSHLNPDVDMLGVNNRNLGTFHTDIENSFRLSRAMADRAGEAVLVSESGISDAQTIIELRAAGFRGFLIGETLMKSDDPSAALSHLISQIR